MSGTSSGDQPEERWSVAAVRDRGDDLVAAVLVRFDGLRQRVALVDTGVRVLDRDRDAAGSLLGSALALRLFLFFVPLLLVVLGLAGLLGRHVGIDGAASEAGLSGALADEIDGAFRQGVLTPWIAVGTGLVGMATTGRSLTRAMVISSALAWRMGGRQKTPIRVLGAVVGIVVGVALLAATINRIREAAGLAVSSFSLVAVGLVYLVLWSLLALLLPRATTDPGAALPGAAVCALTLTGMQAVTQIYLPARIESASAVYGTVGVAITTLGWFFVIGRVIAFSFSLNAVVYERHGSVSGVVFSLPLVRVVPRRFPRVADFFDLDHRRQTGSDGPEAESDDEVGAGGEAPSVLGSAPG